MVGGCVKGGMGASATERRASTPEEVFRQESGSLAPPETATQGEETEPQRDRWGFVEPAIWTERMIAALETGVKGGRWFSLMDKVSAERTLVVAWERVKRNRGAAGVDRQSTEAFEVHA